MKALVEENVIICANRIAYGIYGHGQPVVLLHGTPSSSLIWRNVIPHNTRNGFKVFVYDLLGYGLSERPWNPEIDISISGQVPILEGLLAHWGLETFHLIAHDIGGGIAQRFGVSSPQRLRSLSLIDVVSFDSYPSKRTKQQMEDGLETLIKTTDDVHQSHFNEWLLSAVLFLHQVQHYDPKHTMEIADRIHELGKLPVKIIWGADDAWQVVNWGPFEGTDGPCGSDLFLLAACNFFGNSSMFLFTNSLATLRRSAICVSRNLWKNQRGLLTLAIETSCDDTSVSIVEKKHDDSTGSRAKIHFLENITADSRAHRGIHPILALESHQENLANLVDKALKSLPASHIDGNTIKLADGSTRRRPDFISATRGPGMRSNLSVGLDTGKALSVAWQIPMVGVHHMQAHLLTPRLVSCLKEGDGTLHSKSLTDHKIMASSDDIAIGETLDKAAREILPPDLLQGAKTTMYGKTLEQYIFPNGKADFADYRPPMNRGEEVIKKQSRWGWSLTTPFANTRALQLSFSSVSSMVNKIVKDKNGAMSEEERVDLGRDAMRVSFEHLASRTIIALEALRLHNTGDQEIKTLVVSGGVAANKFLMAVLRSFLDVRGFEHIQIVAPPIYLCTDNAAMIGWAGIEMFEAGLRTDMSCRALRKWTLDPQADDGGILGPSGWIFSEISR
ncbi:uncharacterized protein N7477_007819 [Penicillium maclennaniae]|uniref:uncharacterized protein n=1 Tax=Penicillium maclennaniae TaxID=1343394 RepID=UPI002540DE10|nr:uncharacterized protein N7477_007819 [Penicillium maclennaniae]KAJ5665371.1 hypothetical protein N7477_007819 [Penicillium maclennaniae]